MADTPYKGQVRVFHDVATDPDRIRRLGVAGNFLQVAVTRMEQWDGEQWVLVHEKVSGGF